MTDITMFAEDNGWERRPYGKTGVFEVFVKKIGDRRLILTDSSGYHAPTRDDHDVKVMEYQLDRLIATRQYHSYVEAMDDPLNQAENE